MKIMSIALVVVLTSVSTNSCFSADASLSTDARGFLDRLYLNFFGVYHGAPLGQFTSSHTVDNNGKLSKSGVYLDSEITTAYLITKEIGIGPDIPFFLIPVLGQGVVLGDVGIKLFNRKTVSTDGFNLYANLILQGPTSQFSQNRNMVLGIKSTPSVSYHFSGSRFSVGSWSEIKTYLGVTSGKNFKLYGAPYANYRLTPYLSLNLEYEIEADHFAGQPTAKLAAFESDFQPGVIWHISRSVMVNPYVQIFTNNRFSLNTTSVGAVLNATIL